MKICDRNLMRSALIILIVLLSVSSLMTSFAASLGDAILFDAKRLQTEHFEVIFSPELGPIAREAASIAEKAHKVWTSLLDCKFTDPIHLVLTDEHDEASATSNALPQLVIHLDHPFG